MNEKSKKAGSTRKTNEEEVEVTPSRALSPLEEMDRFLERFFPHALMHRFGWDAPVWRDLPGPFEHHWPRIDVIERDDEILVKAEIPGLEKKDLDVSLTENTVAIKGTSRYETKEEKGNFYRREISRDSFSRTIALPDDVDVSSAKAKFKDGVLVITADKLRESKRHSIKVE